MLWPNNRKAAEARAPSRQARFGGLAFPTFRDGRAYSQARQLRETYGFRGGLAPNADVLRDQFMFLLRAGFDAVEVKKDADVAVFSSEIARHTVFYQPTGDGRLAAAWARHARPAAAAAVAKGEPVR